MASSLIEFVSAEGAGGNALHATGVNSSFLFETIICDVQCTSLQVGTLAMMLTARARPGARWSLRSCRHLLYDDAKATLLALRYGPEIGLDDETVEKMNSHYGRLAEAKRRFLPLTGGEIRPRSHEAALKDETAAWRRVAADATGVLDILEAGVRARLAEVYAQDASTLRQFLKRAANGDARAVDNAGIIQFPQLRQRRRSPRIRLDRDCELILPTGSHRARLLDVSRGGFGVDCKGPLAERQNVIVALPDGRRLEAVVIRRQGTKAGLSLRRSLASTDPLFP